MSRLDKYRAALQVADPAVGREALCRTLEAQGPAFALLVVDHGLGPLWHERTGRDEFRGSRLAAEALFLAQQEALRTIGGVLTDAGIEHAVIKGAANRERVYANPALRACHDLDVLVRPEDRLAATSALMKAGFVPSPDERSISREIVLSGQRVDVDLHWGLLREGRLRIDPIADMLARRRRSGDMWVLADDDALFLLLVHPAFAKHLDAWEMGLHRVLDLLEWLRRRAMDWPAVRARLERAGVTTAAWATLRWVDLLAVGQQPDVLATMLGDLEPGELRSAWLDRWLQADLPARTAGARWLRLLAFSAFLHDTPQDALRALAGQRRAARRQEADLEAFSDLLAQ
jgi:hypothetical protein